MKKQQKCYIYTRVSTSMQVDGYSLDAQKDKLRKYAEYQEMSIVGEYSDEGKSGKSVEGRPQFKQMLSDIEKGKDDVDYVLVFKLSRFGRNAADILSSLQKMQDYGVNLICVEDGIDSSKDAGKLMISVLSAVAEIERENILVQTMEGRRQKAREGRWNGGFAPYGYQKAEDNKNHLVPDSYAAGVVQGIFAKKLSGMSASGIARILNKNGVLAPSEYKAKCGEKYSTSFKGAGQSKWSAQTVSRILKNVVYIGTLAQGKRTTVSHKVKKEIKVPECDWVVVENAHEAIISRMDFDAVQVLMSRDTIAVAGKNESYMYAGILYCGDCGSSMVHRKESYKGREYINYICSNYNRNGKDACSRHCIREEDLNQIVLGELQGYINSMCDCEKVLAHLDELNVNYDEAVAHDKEIVARKQELTKCSAFKASLYQDLRDEIISKEQFTRYREEFSAKERELEQAIREQETIIRDIYENGIAVAKDLEQFREGLVIGNLDRVALVSFIDRILIYDDFRVEIVFKYRQEMEKVTGLFDVANEKNAEPVYTMVDGLPVLELKEAV